MKDIYFKIQALKCVTKTASKLLNRNCTSVPADCFKII